MKIKIIIPINNSDFKDKIAKAVEPVLAPDMTVDVENLSEGTRSIESGSDSPGTLHSDACLSTHSPKPVPAPRINDQNENELSLSDQLLAVVSSFSSLPLEAARLSGCANGCAAASTILPSVFRYH